MKKVNFLEALKENKTKRVRIANGRSDWVEIGALISQDSFTSACVNHDWQIEPQIFELKTSLKREYNYSLPHLIHYKGMSSYEMDSILGKELKITIEVL